MKSIYKLFLVIFLIPRLTYAQHEARIYLPNEVSSPDAINFKMVKKEADNYILTYGYRSLVSNIEKTGYVITSNVRKSKSPICIRKISEREYFLQYQDGSIKRIDLPTMNEDHWISIYYDYLIVRLNTQGRKYAVIPVSLNIDSLQYFDDVKFPGVTDYKGNNQSNNNRGIALNQNGKWALFDTLLKPKSDFIYEKVSGGYFGWFTGNDVFANYITHEGNILIDSLDGIYTEFGDILRKTTRIGNKEFYKYIDRNNNTLVKKTHSPSVDGITGLIPINDAMNKLGYINIYGDTIVPTIYDEIISDRGVIKASTKTGTTWETKWITKSGVVLNINNIYSAINDSTVLTKVSNKYSIVNIKGNKIQPQQFDEVIVNNSGIVVTQNGFYGLLSADCREFIYSMEYQHIRLLPDYIYIQKNMDERFLCKYSGEVIYKLKENEFFPHGDAPNPQHWSGNEDFETYLLGRDYIYKKSGNTNYYYTENNKGFTVINGKVIVNTIIGNNPNPSNINTNQFASVFYSYVNNSTDRKFNIYKNGALWKSVSYNNTNQAEIFGQIIGNDFYSYVNNSTDRKFNIYKNGVLWKSVSYNNTNQAEIFGQIIGNDFYSYVNNSTDRKFNIYKNGTLWKSVSYNNTNQAEIFGQIVGNDFYSYVNNSTDRKFNIYKNGALWKSVSYNNTNQAEIFGQIVGNDFYSYVNNSTDRKFNIYKNGTLGNSISFNISNQFEAWGQMFDK